MDPFKILAAALKKHAVSLCFATRGPGAIFAKGRSDDLTTMFAQENHVATAISVTVLAKGSYVTATISGAIFAEGDHMTTPCQLFWLSGTPPTCLLHL